MNSKTNYSLDRRYVSILTYNQLVNNISRCHSTVKCFFFLFWKENWKFGIKRTSHVMVGSVTRSCSTFFMMLIHSICIYLPHKNSIFTRFFGFFFPLCGIYSRKGKKSIERNEWSGSGKCYVRNHLGIILCVHVWVFSFFFSENERNVGPYETFTPCLATEYHHNSSYYDMPLCEVEEI